MAIVVLVLGFGQLGSEWPRREQLISMKAMALLDQQIPHLSWELLLLVGWSWRQHFGKADVPRVGVGPLEDGVLGKVVDHCKLVVLVVDVWQTPLLGLALHLVSPACHQTVEYVHWIVSCSF